MLLVVSISTIVAGVGNCPTKISVCCRKFFLQKSISRKGILQHQIQKSLT